VLQEREFERVGGSATIRVDVRVIAATNRDLERAIAERSFREDLYYRLAAFPVLIPPLRERSDDIPALVQNFIERYAAKIGRPARRVSEETLARLCAYSWPSNVRELENVIERALILSRGEVLEVAPALLPTHAASLTTRATTPSPRSERSTSLRDAERAHIIASLERAGWKIEGEQGAAAVLGLRPSTLRSRMRKLGIARG
jgi:transcriptional regulator with GAF, ATPase, and Fis domain